jgi:hypothetical protein
MRFAKIVFWVAGIWGLLVITPLYFMFDLIGRQDPPPITHPGFYYGFVGCALAWQLAFCFMATDPVRYRPLIIPSLFEKFRFGFRCHGPSTQRALPDRVLENQKFASQQSGVSFATL